MTLMRIRLELARTPDFPHGSADFGYEFIAPLAKDGHLDAAVWKEHRDACQVTRFWAGENAARGVPAKAGASITTNGADEPFFKLDRHTLLPGNYVSVTESDGIQRPFRVVSVTPVVEHV